MPEDDRALLRRHEPVLRFTRGELFYPVAIEPYLRRCALLARLPGGAIVRLAEPGTLDPERLAALPASEPGEMRFLQFVEDPNREGGYQAWRDHLKHEFAAPGRLARVGLLGRFVDSLFSLSLLLRGTVPGGTTAVAARQYREMRAEAPAYTYHGRVSRDGHYTVLQYLFFYAMNDWRSSFHGVNDHEADWEQVLVYLEPDGDGSLIPAWVAFASHDHTGDDLRRRWDDDQLTIVDGNHPVVHVAAGSHAAYARSGEYLVEVELRFLQPVTRWIRRLRRWWREQLGQGAGDRDGDGDRLRVAAESLESLFRVPFVDYARGDGLTVGPGGEREWEPVLIDDETPWVREYRGLWGLDVQDIFAGELAPAGPRYNRDGSVREAWRDPVGWCGLRKVTPASAIPRLLDEQIAATTEELAALDATIARIDHVLPRASLEQRSLAATSHLQDAARARLTDVDALEAERAEVGRRRALLRETLAAMERDRERPATERSGHPRAHLRHAATPEDTGEGRRHLVTELWAAISVSLVLLSGIALLWLGVDNLLVAGGALLAAVLIVESLFHRRLGGLLVNTVITLAVVTALVLIYEFFWQLALVAVAVIAVFILVENLRELRQR